MSVDLTQKTSASATTQPGSVMDYHVIFVDIVKYSARKPPTQLSVVESLFSIIKNVAKNLGLEGRVKYLPTGDGAAICIQQRHDLPTEGLNFVAELASAVKQWNDVELNKVQSRVKTDFLSTWWSNETKAFALRMGVTVGPLLHYMDPNDHLNVAGTAINQAARLLTLPGPNQVVFSEAAADLVKNAGRDDVRFLQTMSKTIKERSYFGFQLTGPDGINRMPIEPVIEERPRSEGLDELPHLWIRTNHSSWQIVWVPVDGDEWSKVTRMAISHYGAFVTTPDEIERPSHAEGSDVYRVADREGGRPPILLRVLRRPRPDAELRRLCALQKEIANAGIFGRYGECLRPLLTSANREWVQASHDHTPPAIACKFLNEARTGEATHFKGESEEEIENVAEKLGQVNAVLIKSSLAPISPVLFLWDPHEWDATTNAVRSANAMLLRTMYVARAEIPLIERIRNEINALRHAEKYPLTLSDFHPHNVFVSNGECLLIVDYEAVRSDWPEEATCTFALHRFCREYIRRLVRRNRHATAADEVVREAAEAFLRGYGKARPEVINAVKATGVKWAKAVNFAKLMSVIASGAKLREDPVRRTEEYLFREVVKFISYLKELDVFESALSE